MASLWDLLEEISKPTRVGIGAAIDTITSGGQSKAGSFSRMGALPPSAIGRAAVTGAGRGLFPGSGVFGGSSGSNTRAPSVRQERNMRSTADQVFADRLGPVTNPQPQESTQAAPNPLDDLLEMMQGMVGNQPTTYEPDLDDLMDQIRRQIDPVYDARRAALDRLAERAQERTATGREEVEGMYESLAQNYGEEAEVADENMQQAQEEAAALTGELKKNIKGNYSRISEEQADLFKQLGIEEAAPDVLNPQAEDQAFQLSQADQRGALNQNYFNELGAADQAYYQQGAPLARLEGTNRSADLMSMLQDYMAQTDASKMELEGQRTSDITGAFNQLAMQAQQFGQQQSANQDQQQWGRLMDLFGIMSPMYGQQQGDPVGTMSQIISAQLGLGPEENRQFQTSLAELENDPSLIYGQLVNPETGETVDTTRSKVMQLIRNYSRQKGLSGNVENALALWAEQTFG